MLNLGPDDIRRSPAYAGGFEDAKAGEPLFDTASDAYAAGWKSFWAAKALSEAIAQSTADILAGVRATPSQKE